MMLEALKPPNVERSIIKMSKLSGFWKIKTSELNLH